MPTKELTALKAHLKKIEALYGAQGLLSWDLETHMPSKGTQQRALQNSVLASWSHELATDPQLPQWLGSLEAELDNLSAVDQVIVRETRRMVTRQQKLPSAWVEAYSEARSNAHPAWVEARKQQDFKLFLPHLKRLLELNQQQADYLGYEGSPYNALLDDMERGLSVEQLTPLFGQLRPALVSLIQAIQNAPEAHLATLKQAREQLSGQTFPIAQQQAFNQQVLEAMGFDLEAGRVDTAAHPFCCGLGPLDVRLTTCYEDDDISSSLFSIMHEGGHGLYEQGVNPELYGTLLAGGASLGIHESQSRLWENLVGRSAAFWEAFYPKLQAVFPEPFKTVSKEGFLAYINRCEPSFIRVEADEVTYNLHIMLRTEIEQALVEGDLAVEDLPAAWNEKMQAYLGLTPPNDSLGCLQDVHWAHGSFGYFPTYTLGNVASAQFMAKARQALPLESQLAAGDLLPLRNWLKEQIHWVGQLETPAEILQRVCGEGLNATPFVDYLKQKYGALYGLKF